MAWAIVEISDHVTVMGKFKGSVYLHTRPFGKKLSYKF